MTKKLSWPARGFFLILIGICCSVAAHSQAWSQQIASIRATDWMNHSVGVVGGIPSATWTQCGSTIAPYSGTAATINTAMSLCAPNTYVLLAPGAFAISTTIIMVPNVVLRGSGANSTFITFSNTQNSCGGESGDLCFSDTTQYYFGSSAVAPGGTNAATWTSGFAQGTTTITLSNVGSSGIANNQYIYLDQVNDNSAPSTGLVVCDNTTTPCSLEGGSPGRCSVGPGGSSCTGTGIHRNQVQMVKVLTGCATPCTGTGPFTLTITPGLYAANWRIGQTPGAWWGASNMQNSGVEYLSMDHSGSSTFSGATFLNAFNCWELGVRDLNSVRNHVWFHQAAHITIANGYYFATQNGQEESYGVESYISSDNLVENNIFQQVTTPIMMGPAQGSAFVYNFALNDLYALTSTFMFVSIYGNHDAGVMYNLYEGNVLSGYEGDVFHGTGGLATVFRNYHVGWETTKSTNTVAFQLFSYIRFDNVIANVFGCKNTTTAWPGNCGNPYQTVYQAQAGAGSSQQIYDLGSGNSEGSIVVPADPYVAASLLRWGNWDVVTNATRFCTNATSPCTGSEVPSALGDGYANFIPAVQTFPASYFFGSIPPFFPSGKAWPLIGPDVTGGNIAGTSGHANTNPAADCALTVMGMPPDGTGPALPFNSNLCYANNSGPISPGPLPLTVTVTPASASVQTGGKVSFTASVACSDGSVNDCGAVSWSTSAGSVSAGNFQAPSSAGSATVTATATATNSSGSPVSVSGIATVTVTAAPPPTVTVTGVQVSPASVSMLSGVTQQFTALVTCTGTPCPQGVTWTTNEGTVTSGGLFTAGATSGTGIVMAMASGTSTAGAASVTVTAQSSKPPTGTITGCAKPGLLSSSVVCTFTWKAGTNPVSLVVVSFGSGTGFTFNAGFSGSSVSIPESALKGQTIAVTLTLTDTKGLKSSVISTHSY